MSAASAPLSQPLYRATFAQAVSRFFRQFATFTGRASKSEFWWVALFVFLVTLVPNALLTVGLTSGITHSITSQLTVSAGTDPDSAMPVGTTGAAILDDPTAALLIPLGAAIGGVIALALVVPWLALTWRRLHDAGLAGAWFFLSFLPAVGGLFLLVLMLQPAKREGRRFDPAP